MSIVKWEEKDKINLIIATSYSRHQILKQMMVTISTESYQRLNRYFNENKINITHLVRHNGNNKISTDSKRKLSNKEMFVENSPTARGTIKKRLLRDKLLDYKCNDCNNIGEWNNKKLNLQLEHKNGITNDNRLENLCFLCPNCHSQTSTYCGKNIKLEPYINKRKIDIILRKQDKQKETQRMISLVLNSDIDFTKWGWVNALAKLLNKHPQKINSWMKVYMSDFYEEKCRKVLGKRYSIDRPSKYPDDMITQIRKEFKSGNYTKAELGKKYNMGDTIYGILNYKSRKHLTID